MAAMSFLASNASPSMSGLEADKEVPNVSNVEDLPQACLKNINDTYPIIVSTYTGHQKDI